MKKAIKSVNCELSDPSRSYTLENCFMFDEEDTPRPPPPPPERKVNDASCLTASRVMEFRPDKPYRLSLYVQPSLKRKIDAKNPTLVANMSQMKRGRNKENISKYFQTTITKQSKPKANVSLFEEGDASTKTEEGIKHVLEKSSAGNTQSSKSATKSILSYIDANETTEKKTAETDAKFVPKTKLKKIRRSYEKKFKEYPKSENIVEPPSEEILKEIDMKKINRSKIKKPKEDKEFEKWAENMNSAFDDIDKFELSINYD